ncbi:PEPxxWA-CTERM sorting domain-containing protein [Sphingomonas fennica]|uniref:PEPxxWA-CTERM sorting domain-containing protein n=1 Tax=Edaphosphingomonas fennica TaxID=114404 RepID=UPI001FE47CCD|nr:PEPxxWA-CTERM sorting domain-containing protein [Sphingomonas fennica]
MSKFLFQAAAAAFCAAAALSPAQAVVIGSADSSNGIPFGDPGFGYYYQQVYNASSFGSGINISQLSFYNSQTPGGTPRTGSFQIYLSTTSAAIDTFDTSAGAWLDASFIQVFDGALPVLADGRLDIDLSQAFDYDPTQGNLLLTIRSFDLGSGRLFLDTDKNSGLTNSRFSAYPYDWNQGLVTGFNEHLPAVPEPATWAMMITGFGMVGGAIRRRRASVSVSFA